MQTKISIAGWESEGLRCPDHDVNFIDESGRPYRVSLIQMPNGTGKTTTLELLRAALSGSADQWSPQKVRSLRKKRSIESQGHFRVDLLYNTRRLTLGLNFDFDEGKVSYTTTLQSGIKQGFHPPYDIARFLRPEFVNFLVFNGELAEHLLNREYTDAQSVIEDLFQLNQFRNLRRSVQDYWVSQTENKPTEEKGLTRRRNTVTILRQRIQELTNQRADVQRQLTTITDELHTKQRKFDSTLKEQQQLRDRLATAERDLQNACAAVESEARTVLSFMRSPHYLSTIFANEVLDLKRSLDRAKLPESTAREFFEELAEENECVCGRELDDQTRLAIRDRASRYLGSDEMALLNTLKGDIANSVGNDPNEHEAELSEHISSLKEQSKLAAIARTDRDAVDTEGVENDPMLREVKDEIDRLSAQSRFLEGKLSKFDDTNTNRSHSDTWGIAVLEDRLNEHEERLAEITKTLAMKKKRDLLESLLGQAHEGARSGISAEVAYNTNCRIAELMPYNAIRVETIDKSLVLQGQEGGSVGETLSVGYAFLATLFNRAEHELPFVVDSPANPIDLAVRAKIAELIPNLAHQFVAFTISSERNGFIRELDQAANGAVQYLTMFRKGASDLDRAASVESAMQETLDGYCVEGRGFFEHFHVKEEASDAI